jgi:hypothetical protein
MIRITSLDLNSVQQALNALEDKIGQISAAMPTDVQMTVDPDLEGTVPHGASVMMSGDSTVVPFVGMNNAWVGTNVGPEASPGEKVLIRGGIPMQILMVSGLTVSAGMRVYFSEVNAGMYTVQVPPDNPPVLGVIYDASGYNPEKVGYVLAMMNANIASLPT